MFSNTALIAFSNTALTADVDFAQSMCICIITACTYVLYSSSSPDLLPYPYQLDESISNFMGVWYFFIFILFRIDIPVE